MGAEWNRRKGRSAKDWITKNRRQAIYKRDGFACVYCTSRAKGLSLDHLRPRYKNGDHRTENLVTACVSCNSMRGHSSVRAFCIQIAAQTNQDWRQVVRRVKNQRSKKLSCQSTRNSLT